MEIKSKTNIKERRFKEKNFYDPKIKQTRKKLEDKNKSKTRQTLIDISGCMDYADDLDRFINGQIRLEDMQGYIKKNTSIQIAISRALLDAAYYSEKEHDLYEKLCYASVLNSMGHLSAHSLYSKYLVAKRLCAPHKLDWDCLLRKIRIEANINEHAMLYGQDLYERYASGCSSSWYSDDDSD